MKILGLSCFYHDSAAALIIDGQISAAAAEERFSRQKHDNTFPGLAIDYCLKESGLAINELDAIAFYEKPIWKFERILSQHLDNFPKSHRAFFDTFSSWLNQKLSVERILKEEFNYYGKILFVPHHLAHAAESYQLSPFEQSSIVNLDGVGEWATTTVGKGEGVEIDIEQEIRFPHSLGLFYSTMTAYLGFRVNNDEYKVMGLAAYGDPDKYADKFDQLISIHSDGSFSLEMKYFDYSWAQHMPSKALVELFEKPIRKKDSELSQAHKDIAAGLQAKLEEVVFQLLEKVHENHQLDNLCLGGGVALNSVMNGKILRETPFKRLYIAPDPSDAGGAMGAAIHTWLNQAWNSETQREYKKKTTEKKSAKKKLSARLRLAKNFSPYLGPGFSWSQLKNILEENELKYKYFSDRQEFLDKVVSLIRKQKIIGWFQGRMEWGPRALGNRSILTSAVGPEIQDILNAKVKHREMFRPFAPVILKEAVSKYFEADQPLPEITDYMLAVYPFKKGVTADIPGVVHINQTGRLQSITREDNPLYYDLIKTYEKKEGLPILINTSFNVRGEPIVCTPQNAIDCFLGTGIEVLVMDQAIVEK